MQSSFNAAYQQLSVALIFMRWCLLSNVSKKVILSGACAGLMLSAVGFSLWYTRYRVGEAPEAVQLKTVHPPKPFVVHSGSLWCQRATSVHEPHSDWQPISREQFDQMLGTQEAELSPDLRKLYELHKTAIVEQSCFRSEQDGTEHVFVVARSGKQLLFFDDCEDEFAMGVPDNDGVLRAWVLYGDLKDAVPRL
jgi:hypothetical protein